MQIQQTAMLVKLSISQWSAIKYDRKVTDKALQSYAANSDAGRFNKLLVKSDALQEIAKVVSEARQDHYYFTLPWLDDGSRILPSKLFFQYTAKMRKHSELFRTLAERFIRDYPVIMNSAKGFLGAMYDSRDYPDVKIIEQKFGFNTFVYPIPQSSDFRVKMGENIEEQIKSEIESRVSEQVNAAIKDIWLRLHECVKNIAEKLTDKDAKFKDSLIENLRGLLDVVPALNISEDAELAQIINSAKKELCSVNATQLRQSAVARTQVAASAVNILDAITKKI